MRGRADANRSVTEHHPISPNPMASAEAGPPSQLIPATGRLATFAYRFPLPAARLVKFSDCFDGSLGVPNTAALVSSMDRARHDLVHELASGTPSYDNAAAAAKRYVPLIGSTLYSLEQATDPVYLKKPMVFEWCSGIGDPPRTNWMSNQAVVWDKCMSLACEALSRADSVCGSGVDSLGYASAATQLRTAAGIFEHLRKEELPRWVGETSKVERPPEVVEGICEGLSMYCLAEAQMMAVGKSIKGGTAPPSLIAKLCLGVVSQLEACVSTLRSKGGTYYSHLGRPFLTHITFQLQLFRALTYKHLADDAWSKDKYGLSIKHMKEAIDLVKVHTTALPQRFALSSHNCC